MYYVKTVDDLPASRGNCLLYNYNNMTIKLTTISKALEVSPHGISDFSGTPFLVSKPVDGVKEYRDVTFINNPSENKSVIIHGDRLYEFKNKTINGVYLGSLGATPQNIARINDTLILLDMRTLYLLDTYTGRLRGLRRVSLRSKEYGLGYGRKDSIYTVAKRIAPWQVNKTTYMKHLILGTDFEREAFCEETDTKDIAAAFRKQYAEQYSL